MPYYYYGFMDPTYVLILIGALISIGASAAVRSTFRKYEGVENKRRITGAEAAKRLLQSQGIFDVTIREVSGSLTDHYDPRTKTLNLSESVYSATSVSAVGVAAHECGHAMQHANGYFPLKLRSTLVPVANFGSYLAWPLIVIGLLLNSSASTVLLQAGVILFCLVILFQLVTLPVEFNASRRAVRLLDEQCLLVGDEVKQTASVLRAAALTYVASVAASLLQLLRILLIIGSRRRRD